MNALAQIVAGEGVNWRDLPVITDERLYQIERAACAREWHDRRSEYPDFCKWMLAAFYALEDIDRRYQAGMEQQRNAYWAAYEQRKRA